MPKDLAQLQEEVVARGYTHDYGSSFELLQRTVCDGCRIVDSISLDGGTDPGDDVTLYLIEAGHEKGYVIVSDSFHADPRKATLVDELLERSRNK